MRWWGMVRAAAVVFLAGGWIGLAGPSLAVGEPVTGTCDALLVDAADELSPAEETEVQAAAGTLRTDTSFEPRVWVLTQEQDGRDLAEWIELQTAACDTWHAGGSDLTSNFVVLAVTTDAGALTGETYLWYGNAMPDAMDERFPEIQADVINPALTDGDYARGLVDGLAAIGAVIDSGPPIGWIVAGAVVLPRRSRVRRLPLAPRTEGAAAHPGRAGVALRSGRSGQRRGRAPDRPARGNARQRRPARARLLPPRRGRGTPRRRHRPAEHVRDPDRAAARPHDYPRPGAPGR